MISGKINNDWIEEGFNTLNKYREDPVLDSFILKYNQPLSESKDKKIEDLKHIISATKKTPYFIELSTSN